MGILANRIKSTALVLLATTFLCVTSTAQAVHPLYGKGAKICGQQMGAELAPILELMQAQVTENYTVSNLTLSATDARPFAESQSVSCTTSTLSNNLSAFQCTGTVGKPCGVISGKKFICRFLNSKGGEGFHNNSTDSNTASALVPMMIQCEICMPNLSADDLSKLAEFHNTYDQAFEMLLIADSTGSTCW